MEAWIGEHHSGGFEIIASPEMFIAAAAGTPAAAEPDVARPLGGGGDEHLGAGDDLEAAGMVSPIHASW